MQIPKTFIQAVVIISLLHAPAWAGECAVQVFASTDRSGAEKVLGQIFGDNLSPYIVKVQHKGKTFFRVRLGRYATAYQAYQGLTKMRGRLPFKLAMRAEVMGSCPGVGSVEARWSLRVNRLITDWFGKGEVDRVIKELNRMDKASLRRLREGLLRDSYVANVPTRGCAMEYKRYNHLMTHLRDRLGELTWDEVLVGRIIDCPTGGSGFTDCEFRSNNGRRLTISLSSSVAGNWRGAPLGGNTPAKIYLKRVQDPDLISPVKVELLDGQPSDKPR